MKINGSLNTFRCCWSCLSNNAVIVFESVIVDMLQMIFNPLRLNPNAVMVFELDILNLISLLKSNIDVELVQVYQVQTLLIFFLKFIYLMKNKTTPKNRTLYCFISYFL